MNLYLRYLFPDFLLDASKGSLFERAAALRKNVAQRNYLLTYAKRWFVLSVAMLYLGMMGEEFAGLEDVVAVLKICMVLSMSMFFLWFTIWALLQWESTL